MTTPAQAVEIIRTAYFTLTHNVPGELVRLAEIVEMIDLTTEQREQALRELYKQPGVCLEPETLQSRLTQEDHDAAIVMGGEPKTLLTIC
jgi:hypothetical protein